jgi:large subunit ribosomal protein L31
MGASPMYLSPAAVASMKPDIHPVYPFATVTCACGANYEMRTTKNSYNIEICAACHPFFTGKQKLMDTEGRVDRFNRKYKRPAPAAKA